MPLSHVNARRRPPSEAPAPPSSDEDVTSGFEGAFAPPPPPVAGASEVAERPSPAATLANPSNVPLGAPTPFVRVVHNQVGPYPAGHIVPAAAFENLQRLLDLGAVVYDRDAHTASEPDPNMLAARNVAMPVSTMQAIPRAPWVQSSAADLLGPAVPRLGQVAQIGLLTGEHGQQIVVTQPGLTGPPVDMAPVATRELTQTADLGPNAEEESTYVRPEPVQYR